jgi:hypothetical protein
MEEEKGGLRAERDEEREAEVREEEEKRKRRKEGEVGERIWMCVWRAFRALVALFRWGMSKSTTRGDEAAESHPATSIWQPLGGCLFHP